MTSVECLMLQTATSADPDEGDFRATHLRQFKHDPDIDQGYEFKADFLGTARAGKVVNMRSRHRSTSAIGPIIRLGAILFKDSRNPSSYELAAIKAYYSKKFRKI